MDFVVKISNDYIAIDTQIVNPNDLAFEKELKGTGKLDFTITIDNPQIAFIIQFKKVALYAVEDGADELLWSGYIENLDIDFDVVKVTCYDEKKFMDKKILFSNKTWVDPIGDILAELVNESNTRDSGSRGNLSYNTDLGDTVTKDYAKGTKYSSIIGEVADLLNAEWDVVLNEIRVTTSIGTDKTSGPGFLELVSNINSPSENNIISYRQIRSGRDIVTSVIGKDSAAETTATANTAEFGHVEAVQTFSGSSSLADQTAASIAESSVSQGYTEITVDSQSIDFREIEVGDTLAVRVERNNELLDIDDTVKILGKSVSLSDNTPMMTLKFGDIKKPITSPQNFMANLKKDIDSLKLQY